MAVQPSARLVAPGAIAARLLLVLALGCAPHIGRLDVSAAPPPPSSPSSNPMPDPGRDAALEVRVLAAGAGEPGRIDGAVVPERTLAALQASVVAATLPAARRWAERRATPLQLVLELTEARTLSAGGRVEAEVAANVTLRETVGHLYRAQTRVYCKQGADEPAPGAPDPSSRLGQVCIERVARDVAQWLEGIER